MFNALTSTDQPEPVFPAGHPLAALVRPTFDTVRRSMGGHLVSAIWIDSDQDPGREGYRPSYDKLYGAGSVNVMPFIACYLSTGPGTEEAAGGNVVLLPDAIDRSIVRYAQEVGLLGAHAFVRNLDDVRALAARSGRRVYSIDDLGEGFDEHSVVRSQIWRWVNAKDELPSLSGFLPPESVTDMYDATVADFRAAKRGELRVFLKTCNTESAGAGVFIVRTEQEFEAQLAELRDNQRRFGLSRRLVIQPEIAGANRSFQVFLDPERRDQIQVVALTDQLVEADGKTYKASINHPITAATVEPVGRAILDMVGRIWARAPEAFGFLMCDYFQTDEGPVLYDPGLRPTGNTATAMVFHLARKLTGRDSFTSLIHLRTGVQGLTFAQFRERAGGLLEPETLRRTGRGVLPWGWNDLQGFGVLIGVADDEAAFDALREEVTSLRYG
jgi:hypothetical protein